VAPLDARPNYTPSTAWISRLRDFGIEAEYLEPATFGLSDKSVQCRTLALLRAIAFNADSDGQVTMSVSRLESTAGINAKNRDTIFRVLTDMFGIEVVKVPKNQARYQRVKGSDVIERRETYRYTFKIGHERELPAVRAASEVEGFETATHWIEGFDRVSVSDLTIGNEQTVYRFLWQHKDWAGSAAALARSCGVSAKAAGRSVKALVDAGLVQVAPDGTVQLTLRGRSRQVPVSQDRVKAYKDDRAGSAARMIHSMQPEVFYEALRDNGGQVWPDMIEETVTARQKTFRRLVDRRLVDSHANPIVYAVCPTGTDLPGRDLALVRTLAMMTADQRRTVKVPAIPGERWTSDLLGVGPMTGEEVGSVWSDVAVTGLPSHWSLDVAGDSSSVRAAW
jgi:hypothetical protein